MDDDSLDLSKSARRLRCNTALDLIHSKANDDLKTAMIRNLRAFADQRSHDLPDWSLYRCVKHVPNGDKNEDITTDWVEHLPGFFKKIGVNAALIEDIEEILSVGVNKDQSEFIHTVQPAEAPADDGGAAKSAMAELFGMLESDYTVSTDPPIAGEYFGYRRSAHHGDIVRFHITICLDPSKGLLKFDNRYRRRGLRWRVRGFGLQVRQTTYLIGHATSITGGRRLGRGLRLFSLVTHDDFGWYVGPLISMDSDENPIAARILLVPADQHLTFKNAPADKREDTIISMIEEKVTPADIDREIVFDDDEGRNPFERFKCSVLIQAAIFNGTFTTLNARPAVVDQPSLRLFQDLFSFQQRAIKLSRDVQGSILPFLRIARHAEQIIPIDNKTSDYLRDEEVENLRRDDE